jgi:hypothetical protein
MASEARGRSALTIAQRVRVQSRDELLQYRVNPRSYF